MIAAKPPTVDLATVAAHYDDLDLFYRAVWGSHIHHGYWITGKESVEEATLNLTRFVAQQGRIRSGARVWDAGCGYGASARWFSREYGARVTALTISLRQYQIATSETDPADPVDYLYRDALDSGLPSGMFDAAVAIESSEHMADKSRFFAEAFRLLKPQGRLVVAAWLARDDLREWERCWLLEPICAEGRVPGLASASEYLSLLEARGFSEIVFHDLTRQVRKTWPCVALRLVRALALDPSLRRRLRDRRFANRVFAITVIRIWVAYRVGSLRYGVFAATRPAPSTSSRRAWRA